MSSYFYGIFRNYRRALLVELPPPDENCRRKADDIEFLFHLLILAPAALSSQIGG